MLVMSPWSDPVPLTLAWCLFEVYSTIASGATMHVMTPSSQQSGFKDAVTDDYEAVMDALVRIDAERSEAAKAKDKEMIFAAVEREVRFAQLNRSVKDRLREWYLQSAIEIAEAEAEAETGDAKLFGLIGSILRTFGQPRQGDRLLFQGTQDLSCDTRREPP